MGISKFYTSERLRKAVSQFEQENPGLYVSYNVIFGERSAGKSFDTGFNAIKKIVEDNYQTSCVIFRRREEDIRGDRSSTYFSALCNENKISELTEGKWDRVHYYSRKFYFARLNDKTGLLEKANDPFAYIFSLSGWEHNKGTNVPNVSTIIYEEFISLNDYLPQEETCLLNAISTIVRHKGPKDVKIYCLGNALSSYSNPVFRMLGIEKIVREEMKPGQIRIIRNKVRPQLVVAVEFTNPPEEKKDSDVFFCVSDQSGAATMISEGGWQQAYYTHLPMNTKIKREDIVYTFFIVAFDAILQCQIVVLTDSKPFLFVFQKTTELKDEENDLIYMLEPTCLRYNIKQNILNPSDDFSLKILQIIKSDNSLFFADNTAGEIFHNYLEACRRL